MVFTDHDDTTTKANSQALVCIYMVCVFKLKCLNVFGVRRFLVIGFLVRRFREMDGEDKSKYPIRDVQISYTQ